MLQARFNAGSVFPALEYGVPAPDGQRMATCVTRLVAALDACHLPGLSNEAHGRRFDLGQITS